MSIYKKAVSVILAATLVVPAVPSMAEVVDVGPGEEVGYLFEGNEELNKMIDENFEEVTEKGYAELRIPQELHGITYDNIVPRCIETAEKLMDAGYTAYIVGGAVRDLIMGVKSNDFDIVTNATLEQQQEVLDNLVFHTTQEGLTFAYAQYPDDIIDVAQYTNIPAGYADLEGLPEYDHTQRYSDNLLFDSIQRDMPFNTIYYDMSSGDLVDYHGGIHDIREHIINSMVDPHTQFTINVTSAVRALRFKARYGFDFSDRVEKDFRANIKTYFADLEPANVCNQLRRFFPSGYSRQSYEVLMDYDVFTDIFPAVADRADTEEYQTYCRQATDFMDSWFDENGKLYEEFPPLVFLWPAIEEKIKEEPVDNMFTFLSAATQVLGVEQERYPQLYYNVETMNKILIMEYRLLQEGTPDVVMDEDVFKYAYLLLQIRALNDDSLTEAVDSWADRIEAYHTNTEETELADAA